MIALLFSTLVVTVYFGTVQAATTWTQTYGGVAADIGNSLVETSDGGYAIVGSTESFGAGETDICLVKIDEFGTAEWNMTYGGPDYDFGRSLVATADGGYAIAGYTGYIGAGELSDFWLIKTDAYGNEEWNQTYGGADQDKVASLVATADGGYAIAGTTHSSDYMFGDFWLIKTDAYGNEEWNQTYGGIEGEWLYSMVEAQDGGYAMVGTWDLPIFGGSGWTNNSWLVKTDVDGNMEWNQTYEGGNAHSLVATADGGYAIASTRFYDSNGVGGWSDFWLIKTDEFGTVEWNKTYGGTDYDFGRSLVETSDGGYALAGYTGYIGAGGWSDFWLIKTDEFGTVDWNMTYGGSNEEKAFSLVEASDGGYALAGTTQFSDLDPHNVDNGIYNSWLVKADVDGNMEWKQTYGGEEIDEAYSLIEASDGGYVLAGYTSSYGVGVADVWLVKTDEYGVVPEAAWVVLPLLIVATLAIFISKMKLLRTHSKER